MAKPTSRQQPNRGGSPRPAGTSISHQNEVERSKRAALASSSKQDRPKRNPPPRVAMPTNAGTVKVMATQSGYYDHARRHVGDVFRISGKRWPADHPTKAGQLTDFSDRWMVLADANAKERLTTANQSIARKHDDILALKDHANAPGQIVGDDGDGDESPIGD